MREKQTTSVLKSTCHVRLKTTFVCFSLVIDLLDIVTSRVTYGAIGASERIIVIIWLGFKGLTKTIRGMDIR